MRHTSIQERLIRIKNEADKLVEHAKSSKDLNDIKTRFLGRKGEVTQVLRSMSEVVAEERPKIGQIANDIRDLVETRIREKQRQLELAEVQKRLQAETLDISLPGTAIPRGKVHVLQQVLEEIEQIFAGLGYGIVEGPEVETDWYNFVALNIPKDHPARDMQATFYFTDDILLRTHTSPVQIRTMREMAPDLPVRVIVPGKVYRRDPADATHSPVFTQVEGLALDCNITFGDLKGTLMEFARQFYGPKTKVRFRPSYFPFTEPSAEVDVSCSMCEGQGCRVCGGSGWLEVLGCGMVHPKVVENGGYDPEEVQGFAFGIGVERTAMLKYGIDDIRNFYANDLRFLNQF